MMMTCICLVGLMAAVALSVDVGYIQIQKSRMQNAVDAAALAAGQEITRAIRSAPIGTADPTAYARAQARLVAAHVAQLSGVYVDPNADVTFGQRQYDPNTQTWSTNWNAGVSNCVRVVARRNQEDASAQDGKLKLFFAGVIGTKFATVQTEATAFVSARDLVIVHDFSRSMNFDSFFQAEGATRLVDQQIIDNLQKLWEDLQPTNTGSLTFQPRFAKFTSQTVNSTTATCEFQFDKCVVTCNTAITAVKLTYTNGSTQNFTYTGSTTSRTVTGSRDIRTVDVTVKRTSGSQTVTHSFSDTDANLISLFGLGSYPFPSGSWGEFFTHCRNNTELQSRGHREKFGGLTFANYILAEKSAGSQTPRLGKSRHYPFSSIKIGHSLLCDFLRTLSFDDRIGMVSYDTNHRIEDYQVSYDPAVPFVDIRSKPLTDNYTAVDNLMKFKQANYYSPSTNMGGGLKSAVTLLDGYARSAAVPTILLMTDGNSNVMDSGSSSSLPSGWNWNKLFDYDGDGNADYTTNASQARHVLAQAYNAVQKGYIINTMAVGADADRELLKAIAWMGGGEFISVSGGASTEEMEEQLLSAFQKIASQVPPARLLDN